MGFVRFVAALFLTGSFAGVLAVLAAPARPFVFFFALIARVSHGADDRRREASSGHLATRYGSSLGLRIEPSWIS